MNTTACRQSIRLNRSAFLAALFWNCLWINLSEIFRYFVFVMPMMRQAITVQDVAPMNWSVFAIWGIWDLILVFVVTSIIWMLMERFGHSVQAVVLASTFSWLTIFVILWLGLYNMNLATLQVLGVALPLSWLELVVAGFIVRHFAQKNSIPTHSTS